MSQNFARSFTVQQSVQPSEKQIPVDVTLTTPGTAEDVITIGLQTDDLECIREFDFVVDKDCYVGLGHVATSADIPLKAGDNFWKTNIAIRPDYSTKEQQTKISILNAVLGEQPRIRGVVGGY
jgi:hypothetical protein